MGNKSDGELKAYLRKNQKIKEMVTKIYQYLMEHFGVGISSLRYGLGVDFDLALNIIEGLESLEVITPFNGVAQVVYKRVLLLKSFLE